MAFNMFGLQTPVKNYYDILGIAETASVKDIRTARNNLALRYHPDKTAGDVVALAMFKDVQEAFECLSNPSTRDEYNVIRASREPDSDHENVDFDIDQQTWNAWQASFTGRKTARADTYSHNSQESGMADPPVSTTTSNTPGAQGFGCGIPNFPRIPEGKPCEPSPGLQKSATRGFTDPSSDEAADAHGSKEEKPTTSSPREGHWSFYDYFHDDYSEKPMLQRIRDHADRTRRKWRSFCKTADQIKVDLKYADTPEDKLDLQEAYNAKCEIRDDWAKLKLVRDANMKKHEAIAKECLRPRKQQVKESSAANRKPDPGRRQSTRQQARESREASRAYRAFQARKDVPLRRYVDESDDEWKGDNQWRP